MGIMGIVFTFIGCVFLILGVLSFVFCAPFSMKEIARICVSAICGCVGIALVFVGMFIL